VCLCYATSSSPTKLEALASNSRGNTEGSTSSSAQLRHMTEKYNLRQVLPFHKKEYLNKKKHNIIQTKQMIIKIKAFIFWEFFLFGFLVFHCARIKNESSIPRDPISNSNDSSIIAANKESIFSTCVNL